MTHDVAEDVDIYSDLSTVNYSDTLKQLETSNRDLLLQVKDLKQKLSSTTNEKERLEARCQSLSFNISSLFKTAQSEIERKNKTISELRSEINNAVFRRNKAGRSSWCDRKDQGKSEVSSFCELKGRRDKCNDFTEGKSNENVRKVEMKLSMSKHEHLINSTDSKGRDKITSSHDNVRRGSDNPGTKTVQEDSLKNKINSRTNTDMSKLISVRTSSSTKSESSQIGSQSNVTDIFTDICINENSVNNKTNLEISDKHKFEVSNSINKIALTHNFRSSSSNSHAQTDKMIAGPPVMTEYSKRMLRKLQNIPTKIKQVQAPNLNSGSCDKICLDYPLPFKESSPKLADEIVKDISRNISSGTNKSLKSSCTDNSNLSQSALLPNQPILKKFSPFSQNHINSGLNVSADLSISSSSSSDAGESNTPKTCLISKSLELMSKEEKNVNSKIEVEFNNTSKPCKDEPELPQNIDSKKILPNDESIQRNSHLQNCETVKLDSFVIIETGEQVTAQNEIEISDKSLVIDEQQYDKTIQNPCTDSVICNSNSLHDILNVSNSKNSAINVTYELFSLESIDKFATSPKKDISLEESFKKNASNHNKLLDSELSRKMNVDECKQLKSLDNKSVLYENKTSLNSNLGDSHSKEVTLEKGQELIKDISIDVNLEKTGAGQNIINVHEEVVGSINDKIVETFTSDNSLISSKTLKNSIKTVINPISSLWAKSYSKNSEKSLSIALEQKKKCGISQNHLLSKSDIVQSLFGSPVKWADSDSIDFIPPTLDHDPSIFEDSRSGSNGMKTNINSFLNAGKNDKVFKNAVERSNHLFCSKSQVDNHDGSVKTLTCGKIILSDGVKCKYEDTTLGQFEDTLQFVSALSSVKESVSPIGTPEKLDLSTFPNKTTLPFSSVKINQKAGFKIVGPNEKPINILTPRKTPRIVSPKKINLAGTSPNGADSKNCRISCIDDKAIESVCNLVSSIKETNHRETYLIIPKKCKTKNSPKKISDSVLHSEKSSPNKSPKKVSPIQKKSPKTNAKSVPHLKLSPKKKALNKINKSLDSKNESSKQSKNDCINLKINNKGPEVEQEIRGIKFLDSLPLIPKLNNCTKIKMSYELKKPSRMNRKGEIKKKDVDMNDKASCNVGSTCDELTPREKVEQMEINSHEYLASEQNLKNQNQGDEFPRKSFCTAQSYCLSPSGNNKNVNDTEPKESEKDNGNDKPIDVQIVAGAQNENTSKKSNFSQVEKVDLHISGSSEGKITANIGKENFQDMKCPEKTPVSKSLLEKERNQLKHNTDMASKNEKNPSNKLPDGKPNDLSVFTKKRSIDTVFRTFDSKTDAESKYDYKSRISSFKASESRNSISPPSHSSKSERIRTSKSSSSKNNYYEELSKLKRLTKYRRRSRSSSSDSYYYSSNRYSSRDNYRTRVKGNHVRRTSQNYHESRRSHRNYSYRKQLSSRYSCYRRREPSVFSKLGKSPEKDFTSIKYSNKIKYHDNLLSGKNHPQHSQKKIIYKESLPRSNDIHLTKERSWGSSPVTAVSVLSSKLRETTELYNQSSYDRMNGISCNNIKWKLIKLDGVIDYSPIHEGSQENATLSQLLASTDSCTSSTIQSPKIISKKKTRNFSSSDIKTDNFSSTPKKNALPEEKVAAKDPNSSTLSAGSDHSQISNKNGKTPAKKIISNDKNCHSHLKSPDSSVRTSGNIKKNTVTYRIPSFLNKSTEEIIKTVEVSRIKNKSCGVFSSASDVQSQEINNFSDESDISVSSFTSDESWAPKKKRKKK